MAIQLGLLFPHGVGLVSKANRIAKYYTSIGLAMRFRRVRDYLKEPAAIAFIKLALVPILATTTAYFMGFRTVEGGLPLKVVLILSSMPAAFNALIPPSIYDLDLANSCRFVTTLLLIIVLPIQLWVIGFLIVFSKEPGHAKSAFPTNKGKAERTALPSLIP